MTKRQAGLADDLSFKDPERRTSTVEALCRFVDAMEPFEKALEGYREELLKNMEAYCPRAAKRLREGQLPRRTRKRAGPLPAVDEAGSPR
jgi:hypothetical protein